MIRCGYFDYIGLEDKRFTGAATLPRGVNGTVTVIITDNNYIEIELSANKDCDDCDWLQFVVRRRYKNGKEVQKGKSYKTSEKEHKLGKRSVDSASFKSAFYIKSAGKGEKK